MRRLAEIKALLLMLSLLLACGGEGRSDHARAEHARAAPATPGAAERDAASAAPSPTSTPTAREATPPEAPPPVAAPARRQERVKILYDEMDDAEKRDFLLRRGRLIALKISGEPYQFTDSAISYVKEYVDVYARRVNNGVRGGWGCDLNRMFVQAQQYAPCINRAFEERNVSPVVGLYIVAVETEFTNFPNENAAGAAGLFQFIPSTAREYGVRPEERGDLPKMSDAAARYMAHRISEFGGDAMSVALAIASYNRSPDSVRRDLKEVLNARGANKERSFWTLITSSSKLDKYFREENVKYVPKFFASAIVGETPWAFRLSMRQALSTYESSSAQCPRK